MTPIRALHASLACDAPDYDDEIPARDVALSVLGSLGCKARRVAARAVHGALAFERSSLDPQAALVGGARDDGGDLVHLGGSR